jgi:probable HAF family extracellular repeat protein
MRVLSLIAITALVVGIGTAARTTEAADAPYTTTNDGAAVLRYRVKDIGTLGGSNATPQWITDSGDVIGWADNGIPSGYGYSIQHAFRWHNGRMQDLVTPNGRFTYGISGNDHGQVAGQTFLPDDFTSHAAVWNKRGVMTDLGTFGGAIGWANSINNRGQITGTAATSQPSPYHGQQLRPYVLEDGLMTEIGTLGGAEGFGSSINDEGEVVGGASEDAKLVTGFNGPPFFAFHWKDGLMTKLDATGAVESFAIVISNRSQVVGECTFGSPGTYVTHACLWERNGADESYGPARDLGTLAGDPDSEAFAINEMGQIVGATGPNYVEMFAPVHAFLWQNGSMYDLNTLIPANSGVQLIAAYSINDRGEIAAQGVDGNGFLRAILLTPEDE